MKFAQTLTSIPQDHQNLLWQQSENSHQAERINYHDQNNSQMLNNVYIIGIVILHQTHPDGSRSQVILWGDIN